MHPQNTKCTPRQSKSQFFNENSQFYDSFCWARRFGGSFSTFRPSLEGDELKKLVNFLSKKVHLRQNPGYAYATHHTA